MTLFRSYESGSRLDLVSVHTWVLSSDQGWAKWCKIGLGLWLGFEFTHEQGVILNQSVTFQAELLYATSDGERRIKITTSCFPIATSSEDFMNCLEK